MHEVITNLGLLGAAILKVACTTGLIVSFPAVAGIEYWRRKRRADRVVEVPKKPSEAVRPERRVA